MHFRYLPEFLMLGFFASLAGVAVGAGLQLTAVGCAFAAGALAMLLLVNAALDGAQRRGLMPPGWRREATPPRLGFAAGWAFGTLLTLAGLAVGWNLA